MADKDLKNRYWKRLHQLSMENVAARKAGDFELSKKKQEDIRRIASVPFDSYMRKVDGLDRPKGLGPAYPINNGATDDDSSEELDAEPEFGQPVNAARQQQATTAGQEEADRLREKLIYKPEQPTVKEEPVGGKAITAHKQPEQKQAQPTQSKAQQATGAVVDRGKQVARQALDQALKYAKKAAAQLLKKAVVSFFASPYGWPIVAIILGLIAIGIIILIFIGIVYGNHTKVSDTGSTIPQEVNPLNDKEHIQRLLRFSKEDSVTKTLTEQTLKGLEMELSEIKQLPQYADKVSEIEAVLADITKYRTSKTEEDGRKLIASVKALAVSLLNAPPMPSTITTSCTSEFCKDTSFGNGIHIGTPLNKCSGSCSKVAGSPARTFIQFKQNTCDAVDLSQNNGTPVNAIFDGTVVKRGEKYGLWVQNGQYTANYAHVNSSLQEGTQVKMGQTLGTATLGHVHFELSYGSNPASGRCVVLTRSEYDAGKAEGKTQQAILWAKMKAVMRLP